MQVLAQQVLRSVMHVSRRRVAVRFGLLVGVSYDGFWLPDVVGPARQSATHQPLAVFSQPVPHVGLSDARIP